MSKPPASGIRILDLTQAMAGPFATMLLGDLGCDVIKVEPPKGDQTRRWAPPYQSEMSAYFLSANRNKRSIAVDLKTEAGRQLVLDLIKGSDVLIENFRPGTMEKLGIGYDKARDINPGIIYCSLSGYGQSGPFREYPGYDLTLLSYTGLLSITGEEGRPPVKFGVPIADIVSGMFATIAILGSLLERTGSGEGQFIDMSMFDANLLTLTHQAFSYFATGIDPKRLGSAHSTIAPYQAFETSDGYVSIALGTEKLWGEFLKCLNISGLENDPRYVSNMERVRNRAALSDAINAVTKEYTTSDLVGILRGAGVPSAPINTVGEALSSEQAVYRDMVMKLKGRYGEISSLGTPFKMSRTPGVIERAAPMLGEHTDEILREMKLDEVKIAELKKKGVVNSGVKPDSEL